MRELNFLTCFCFDSGHIDQTLFNTSMRGFTRICTEVFTLKTTTVDSFSPLHYRSHHISVPSAWCCIKDSAV